MVSHNEYTDKFSYLGALKLGEEKVVVVIHSWTRMLQLKYNFGSRAVKGKMILRLIIYKKSRNFKDC